MTKTMLNDDRLLVNDSEDYCFLLSVVRMGRAGSDAEG